MESSTETTPQAVTTVTMQAWVVVEFLEDRTSRVRVLIDDANDPTVTGEDGTTLPLDDPQADDAVFVCNHGLLNEYPLREAEESITELEARL